MCTLVFLLLLDTTRKLLPHGLPVVSAWDVGLHSIITYPRWLPATELPALLPAVGFLLALIIKNLFSLLPPVECELHEN